MHSVTSQTFASWPFWLKCFLRKLVTLEKQSCSWRSFSGRPRPCCASASGGELEGSVYVCQWTDSVTEKDDRVRLGRRSDDDLCASEECSTPMYAMGVDHPKCIGSENVVSTLLALPAVRRRGRGGARVFGSVERLMTTTRTTTATQSTSLNACRVSSRHHQPCAQRQRQWRSCSAPSPSRFFCASADEDIWRQHLPVEARVLDCSTCASGGVHRTSPCRDRSILVNCGVHRTSSGSDRSTCANHHQQKARHTHLSPPRIQDTTVR